jgi:hypothetical protein
MVQDNSKVHRRRVDRRCLARSQGRSRRLNSRHHRHQVQARNSRRPVLVRGHSKARSKARSQARNKDRNQAHSKGHSLVRLRSSRGSSSTPSIRSHSLPDRIIA